MSEVNVTLNKNNLRTRAPRSSQGRTYTLKQMECEADTNTLIHMNGDVRACARRDTQMDTQALREAFSSQHYQQVNDTCGPEGVSRCRTWQAAGTLPGMSHR